MKSLSTLSLKWSPSEFQLLDQTLLPKKEVWIKIENLDQMIEAIKSLRVRGAPLIGVSACLFLAYQALRGQDLKSLNKDAQLLKEARPTAVNLMNNIDQLLKHFSTADDIVSEAVRIFNEDQTLCDNMSTLGAELIQNGDTILTHCNTGSLATAGAGTALGVIKKAHQQGKKIHVYVDETRPLLQGARLTAWELAKEKIPFTLITDSMAAFLMRQGKVTKAFVGCDRIATNGDFANKIGTYSVAALCHLHKIPFYVVGPRTTVDSKCPSGKDIPIEERISNEVTGFHSSNESINWAPENTKVYNPSFDVTPNEYVTAWVLDHKIITHENLGDLC
ncbi:MAG: S-methyl-5-thioribose-1-phosphate isomerase [Bdellovibrionaceae bacterium]|jgi:methylthioribose-1-phosphate isomerase|nr:S-methyl-5-thioribose-1-phosphate isomerase [Pseudobdellovibrionaceae bacterium]